MRKKAVQALAPETSTPKSIKIGEKLSDKDVSTRFNRYEKLASESSDESDVDYIDYAERYSSFYRNEISEINDSVFLSDREPPSNANETLQQSGLENHLVLESPPPNASLMETCANVAEIIFSSPPNHMSTPIPLQDFEDPFVCDVKYYSADNDSNYDDGDELYLGSSLNTVQFFKSFNFLGDRHKLSKLAKDDFLSLFSTTFPRPNNINSKKYICPLPNIFVSEAERSSIVTIDLLSQLHNILVRNSKNILLSWSPDCSWADPLDNFGDREVHLVLNLDGASVFRSQNISVWPVWVQVLNLPPPFGICEKFVITWFVAWSK